MSLKVGNTIPRRLYKGNSLVTRVYKGDTLQWERLTREGRSFVSPADGDVSLDSIYGKSLVWNQMVPDAKINVPIDTYNYASYVTGLTFTNGHKYLVVLDNSELMVRMCVTGTSYTSTSGQKILVTFTGTTGTGSPYQIQLSGTSTKVSHIKMHDLTMMFGVGNEPSTVEEFEALFPDSYYPYDEGSVLHLGGNPIVWNQLVKNCSTKSEVYGITRTKVNNYTVHYEGTSTYSTSFQGTDTTISIISGHKHYVAANGAPSGTVLRGGTGLPVRQDVLKAIITSTATDSHSSLGLRIPSGTSINNDVSFICIDLTLMFGEGNEPATVEEFEKLFPLPYYPYNSGTDMKASTIDIDVKGFNQWDEEWEVGGLYADGSNKTSTSEIRTKNFIPVLQNTTYYLKTKAGINQGDVHFYDANKVHLSGVLAKGNRTFIIPSGCMFIKVAFQTTYGTTYNHDICINISNPIYNGQYKPHRQEKTVSIPLTTLTSNGEFIFHDGIRGIGTARDEVGENKVIKRIAVVDLGTLDWSGQEIPAGGGHIRFSAPCAGIAATNLVPNILNAYGFYGDMRPIKPTFVDKALAYYNGRIYLYDSAYTDAATFKAAMSGVMLYYELAEPIEYPLDIPFKVEYEIVEGGTESLVGLTAPIKEDIALNYK